MILDPRSSKTDKRSALVAHIAGKVDALCGREFEASDENVEELARAVETFIEQTSDSAFVDSSYLVVLTSQALSAIGHEDAARRLLVFGTGLVRPSQWIFTGGETVWVLDLEQISVTSGAYLEMVLFNSLNVILASIADVWDDSDGRGILGLWHVCSVVAKLLGGDRSGKKDSIALAEEIRELCLSRLEKLGAERGWNDIPRVMVMNLDK